MQSLILPITKIYNTRTMTIINLAAYKFVKLTELTELRIQLKTYCQSIKLTGTILLSSEGINFCLAGSTTAVTELKVFLAEDARFADIVFKESISALNPFKRMLVKIKAEIIPLGIAGIDPAERPAPSVSPQQLKQWLDEGRDIVLLDTRNDYEIEYGSFKNVVKLDLQHFRTFPQMIQQLPAEYKDKPVVSFCTGGVRCEKAAPFLQQQGFKEVYQLAGGILKYFEECGGEHYQGDCYVFDKRVALTPELQPAKVTQCYICSFPVAQYAEPETKPRCHRCSENS